MSEANSREQKQREDTGGRGGIVEDDEEEDEEKEGKEEEEEETSQTKTMTDSCENKSDARRSKTNTKRLDRDARTRTHSLSEDGCANAGWSCGGRQRHTPRWRHAGLAKVPTKAASAAAVKHFCQWHEKLQTETNRHTCESQCGSPR